MKNSKGKLRYFLLHAFLYAVFVAGSATQINAQSFLPADYNAEKEETISINIKNIEIGDFFRGLAKRRNINIIVGKDVSGTISVSLHNIPLTKALYAVSRANGYQCIKRNGIYFILEEEESGNNDKRSGMGNTVKSFRINYAEISEVRKLVEDIVGDDSVAVHQEAKTLIIHDTLDNIAKVEKILKKVDYAPHQVLIEAKILEIQLGENLSFGVDWEKTFTSGNYAGTLTGKNFALPPDTDGASGFFMEVFKNNQELKANLDALESQSDLNVLATPKLWAVDGKPAEILIGGRLGYYEVTTTETSTLQSVQFLDTGTQLNLTPNISKDGKILMELHPSISEGTIDDLGLPSQRTTEVTTAVLAEHGDTIFIGGLIRQVKQKNRRKIPLIGSIPLIGTFFGRTEDKLAKNEIIVIITPYIVSPKEKMIKQEKVEIVERAEEIHDEEESTFKKLFSQRKMYETIQGTGDKKEFEIKNRKNFPLLNQKNVFSGKIDNPSGYSLLVSSFYEQNNAETMTQNLKNKGYPAYLLATSDKTGTPVAAVKIGPFPTQKVAEEFNRRLKDDVGITALTIEE